MFAFLTFCPLLPFTNVLTYHGHIDPSTISTLTLPHPTIHLEAAVPSHLPLEAPLPIPLDRLMDYGGLDVIGPRAIPPPCITTQLYPKLPVLSTILTAFLSTMSYLPQIVRTTICHWYRPYKIEVFVQIDYIHSYKWGPQKRSEEKSQNWWNTRAHRVRRWARVIRRCAWHIGKLTMCGNGRGNSGHTWEYDDTSWQYCW